MHRRNLSAVAVWAGLASAAVPQGAPRAADPYTRGEPAALAAAGYVSLGPFVFGDGHDTAAVEATTGEDGWLWLETAHWKIGSTLAAWPLAKAEVGRSRFRDELARLRRRLPRVPANAAVLDPWLRLHLHAQRCEELYRDFQQRLGVDDATFPDGKAPTRLGPDFIGEGPFLGQRGKYTLLLCGRTDLLARYVGRHVGANTRSALRHHFPVVGSMLFVTAEDLDNGLLQNDVALHCHVVYHVVNNLLDGYKSHRHELPVWLKIGLAQRYAREVAPHYQVYDFLQDPDAVAPGEWDWRPKVAGLAATGAFTPAATLLDWMTYDQLRFADYMTCWSRVDWLLQTREQGLRTYLDVMKAPFHEGRRDPSRTEVLERQQEAMRQAWDLDARSFDERWRAWARKTQGKR